MGKANVEVAVDTLLEVIAETLRSNERVDLRGFGSFVVKDRKERQGRNPRTGETITIAARREASFRPGKELTEGLAQGVVIALSVALSPSALGPANRTDQKTGVSQGGSYVVCLNCGQEFAYDTCAMRIGEPISRANISGMVHPPPRGSMAPQAPIHGR